MKGPLAPLQWTRCRSCGREVPTVRICDGLCVECDPAFIPPHRTREWGWAQTWAEAS